MGTPAHRPLSDQEALEGGSAQRRRITELGLQYSLLTQYTSFIAVDHLVRNPNPALAPTVNQPSPMPEGVSDLWAQIGARCAEVPSTPEPTAWLALLIVAGLCRRAGRRGRRAPERSANTMPRTSHDLPAGRPLDARRLWPGWRCRPQPCGRMALGRGAGRRRLGRPAWVWWRGSVGGAAGAQRRGFASNAERCVALAARCGWRLATTGVVDDGARRASTCRPWCRRWRRPALGCAVAACVQPTMARAPFAGLAVLALPVVSSLQFYAGYPLRLVTAELSTWALQAVGMAAARSGTAMTVEGQSGDRRRAVLWRADGVDGVLLGLRGGRLVGAAGQASSCVACR